jgi:hypothetical protein
MLAWAPVLDKLSLYGVVAAQIHFLANLKGGKCFWRKHTQIKSTWCHTSTRTDFSILRSMLPQAAASGTVDVLGSPRW